MALQEDMRLARKAYLSKGELSDSIRPEIRDAWKRCTALRVDPSRRVPRRLTDPEEIKKRLCANENLLRISGPAIEYLYRFLRDAHLFVSVSDADGWLLWVTGDTTMIDPSNDILYTSWHEQDMGNNPIGTSLCTGHPCMVSGYEHFCKFPQYFTGVGAPIHDPSGAIIGAISMTHISKESHMHTQAVIVMTAYAIEQQLAQKEANRQTERAYRRVQTILNAASDGFIVISNDGKIDMVNEALLKMINASREALIDQPVWNFIKEDMLKGAIKNSAPFTDFVTSFWMGKDTYPCSISHRVIKLNGSYESLLIVAEMARVEKLAKKLRNKQSLLNFSNIIVEDQQSKRLVESAKLLANNEANILLLGESGTGKDVYAQAIHNASPRYNGPFIPINCGAIQKELFISELFGYESGAYTGAKKEGAVGKLEAANGGTVFLDEIGEMPLEVQPILLRALEQRVITRIGGKEFIPVDIRVIAATNKDLDQEVRNGKFRQDLFYRLNIFSLELLPLRERPDDIIPLSMYFIASLNGKYGKTIAGISPDMQEIMKAYPWPGNVRELRNYMERLVAFSRSDIITPEVLSLTGNALSREMRMPATAEQTPPQGGPIFAAKAQTTAKYGSGSLFLQEREELRQVLESCHWNITKVSQYYGITRATVYRRMEKLGLRK